jgi:hypothetical protein
MTSELKPFSGIPFLLCVILFFFPFVNVSCRDQPPIRSLTGMELAIGPTIEQPQLFGPPRKQKLDPEPLASIALLCAVLGAATAFAVPGLSALLGGAGAIVLLLLKFKIDKEVLERGGGLFQVDYGFAYWLSFLLLLVGCGINACVFCEESEL